MMQRPIIIAVLAIAVVVAILAWRGSSPSNPVVLSNLSAWPVEDVPGEVHVTMTIETMENPDILIGVSSPVADLAILMFREATNEVVIPARSAVALSQDGIYLRLSGLEGPLTEGRLIPLTLTFLRSGEQTGRARVVEAVDPHALHRAEMAARAETGEIGPAPELSMQFEPAANGATQVQLDVKNFTFGPQSDQPEHVAGEGHAHLYLDGLKLQRMYEGQALIGALPPGEYEVRVELNTNLHVPYLGPDGPVQVSKMLVVE